MSLRKIESYKDIKVAEGEIVIIPWDNRLLELPPYSNDKAPVPQWVKDAPMTTGSIRRCAATMDYISSGITIPAWTNFRFNKTEGEDSWIFSCDQFEGYNGQETEPFSNQPFSFEQTGSCPVTKVRAMENNGYPKLVNPFRVITAPGWSTLVLPALYEPSPHYSVLPGIVNTDYYHESNCVLNLIGKESFSIPWGAPLMHLIPIKRSTMAHTIEFLDESAFKHVIGRGFGSGALKPSGNGWSSARLYRGYKFRRDAELAENSKKKKWGRNK
jgi:hypothetical protein